MKVDQERCVYKNEITAIDSLNLTAEQKKQLQNGIEIKLDNKTIFPIISSSIGGHATRIRRRKRMYV